MSDGNGNRKPPVLKDLVKAAEPSRGQKFINFVGLGYVGNTAVSVTAVKLVRKMLPKLTEKWEAKYAQKYYDRKFEEIVAPVAGELDEASKTALEEKIKADAKVYGEKTVDSRLLITGGFAMLPFQSAMQVRDYKKNMKPALNGFRDAAKEAGYNPEETQSMLVAEVDRQKAAVRSGDKKSENILDGALEQPEFSPLGPAARKDLPKWGVGRVLAVGSAFFIQTIIDDRFAKPKDALDTMLAKIITRVVHPKGYDKPENFNNQAFAENKAASDVPEGVDPKVLDVVRMVTTDAYMTTVAIAVQKGSMDTWDKKRPDVVDRFKDLRQRLSSHGQSV